MNNNIPHINKSINLNSSKPFSIGNQKLVKHFINSILPLINEKRRSRDKFISITPSIYFEKGVDGAVYDLFDASFRQYVFKIGMISNDELKLLRNTSLMREEIIPKVHATFKLNYSTSKSIGARGNVGGYIQEFFGQSLNNMEYKLNLRELKEIVYKLDRFKQITGFFHGDIHFGNILYSPIIQKRTNNDNQQRYSFRIIDLDGVIKNNVSRSKTVRINKNAINRMDFRDLFYKIQELRNSSSLQNKVPFNFRNTNISSNNRILQLRRFKYNKNNRWHSDNWDILHKMIESGLLMRNSYLTNLNKQIMNEIQGRPSKISRIL